MIPSNPKHPDDLLTATECQKILKISRRTFQRLRADGRIPQPHVHTSRTTVRWRRGDILALSQPKPEQGTLAHQLHAISIHVRAAAMQARTAAISADAAATHIRKLITEEIAKATNSKIPELEHKKPAIFHEGAD